MGRLKKFFTRDWHAKLGALICAIILWFSITATQSSIVSFPGNIPIDFKNIKDGLVAISGDENVQIKIRSENINLSGISQDNFKASIDLSSLDEGTYNKNITVSSKNPNIQISSITPSSTTVRIGKKVSKAVPVRIRLGGSAAEGFGVSNSEIAPPEVSVSGPESVISNVTEAVAPIKLNGENANFSKNTQLFVYSASGQELKDISIEPKDVEVSINITRVGDVKTLGIKINLAGNLKPGYFISATSSDPEVVTVGGNSARISLLKYVETEPVDITGLSENKTVSAKLNLPTGVTTEGQVMSVQISLVVSKSDSTREISLKPSFINLPSNLTVSSFNPTRVLVVFTGSPDTLNQINNDNVKLNIDLSGTSSGTNEIELKSDSLKYPSSLTPLNFTPDKLFVIVGQK